MKDKNLAIIGGGKAATVNGRVHCNRYNGVWVELLAEHFKNLTLCMSDAPKADELDWTLPENVSFTPHAIATTAIQGFRSSREISKSYRNVVENSDYVFIRGNLIPAIKDLYRYCAEMNKPVCHWLVGNPMALLRSHRRHGFFKDLAGQVYTRWWDRTLLHGRAKANGALLCNGQEIADRFASPRTHVTVSSTVRNEDFFIRDDTCLEDPIRLLCIGFVRPEKGIEYLLESMEKLKTRRLVELTIVGSRNRYPDYQEKLDEIVDRYGLRNQVNWAGHADADQIKVVLQQSDIFVLPTLSEGTPRVLVEARACGLPIVSTNVGGIPSSVRAGHDGLLVPPKSPHAMATAIDRIIEDVAFRRLMIQNGYSRARELTVDYFVDQIIDIFQQMSI